VTTAEAAYARLEAAARELLDAMDRQHGQPLFSIAVANAREALREIIPTRPAAIDRSRAKAGVA
jgi:hypothetical protein